MDMDYKQILEKIEPIEASIPQRSTYAGSKAVKYLSRRVAASAITEVMKAAVTRYLKEAYAEDEEERLVNINHEGRVIIVVPWGRAAKEYGVGRRVAEVLQRHMNSLESGPVTSYNRRWYINLEEYPTLNHALTWVDNQKLSGLSYIDAYDRWKNG